MEMLGFPAPLLGEKPLRLPVLSQGPGWVVLDKPAGIATHPHPAYKGGFALDRAMQVKARALQPEWLRILPGINGGIKSCYFLEPGLLGGPALFSWEPSLLHPLRNAYGSRLFQFQFQLLARDRKPEKGTKRICELPLTDPGSNLRSVRVSHRRGKTARTCFHLVEAFPGQGWAMWRAETRLLRPGQLTVHALECGLAISGDADFAGEAPIFREHFYRNRRMEATPLLPGPAIRLAAVHFPADWGGRTGDLPCGRVEAPEPKLWTVVLRKLRG